jgi:D-tyrosyl-tRNA(Tyr) deacylase
MRACVQRVKRGSVTVDGHVIGQIGHGFVVLLGVAGDDSDTDLKYTADKIMNLRVFEDDAGKMNLSLVDVVGQMLVVSQFTLMGDCRKGRRPSFIAAAPPEMAIERYEQFVAYVREQGVHVETGKFQAMMDVELVNDGPVTMLIDSRKGF